MAGHISVYADDINTWSACISPKSNTSRTNAFTYHLLVVFLINCNLTILFRTVIGDDERSLFEGARRRRLQDSYGGCNDTLSEPLYLQAPTRCTQVTCRRPSSATAAFHSENCGNRAGMRAVRFKRCCRLHGSDVHTHGCFPGRPSLLFDFGVID